VQYEGAEPDESELRAFMKARLVLYKNPRTYEFTTSPLRDDSGKVRRAQLRAERVDAMVDGAAREPAEGK
jgi:bile acid-coenzyme A ligase